MKIIILMIVILLLIPVLTGCDNEEEAPGIVGKYKDGTYTGYSDTGEHGYAWAKVTIKNDDITEVELMEMLSKGTEKDYDTYQYEASVEAWQEMPARFEEADSADVDVYAGATNSSDKFKQAVSRALKIASGEMESKYFDGKFQGSSDDTEYGYAVALVTIKDDTMSDVELKEVESDGEWRDYSTYDWEPAVEANEEMAERFVEANSPDVDMYTEATQSSIKYKTAVERALNHAATDPADEIE